MSTIKPPVRRQRSSVYWRRRLTVLLALAALVAVVLLIVLRPGSGSGASSATGPTRSATPAPAASGAKNTHATKASGTTHAGAQSTTIPTTEATASGGTCAASNVDVEALTDATGYGEDQQPLLSLSITNTGSHTCTIDAGTAAMVFTITSGPQQYWTSTDCQQKPVHTVIKLQPHKTLTSAPLPWDRSISSKTTCDQNRPAAPAGGASYHLSVSVDGIPSRTTKQFALNG